MTTSHPSSAVELAAAVRRGDVSGIELVDEAIEGLQRAQPALNLLASERFERAREEARHQQPGGQPFAGVPILVKDLGCELEGEIDTMGSALLRRIGRPADRDGSMARRLREAGFIILGRTTSPEFGIRSTTESEAYGSTVNPWSAIHSTGGSSGGSAAAVAAGLVPLAQGSDGAGSLRMPASLCGVLAMKPSRARISQSPMGETMMGHSEYGPLARCVDDLAAFLDACAGAEPGDPTTCPPPPSTFASLVGQDPGRLRVGGFTGTSLGGVEVHAAHSRAVQLCLGALAECGHDVSEEFPAAYDEAEYLEHFIDTIAPTLVPLLQYIGSERGSPIEEHDVEPSTWYWYTRGLRRQAGELAADLMWLDGYRRRMGQWFSADADLLVAPSFMGATPKLGYPEDGAETTRRNIDLIRATAPFNTTGQPAMTIPITRVDGLPVGVQIVAPVGREDLLLQVGRQLEDHLGWREWTLPG